MLDFQSLYCMIIEGDTEFRMIIKVLVDHIIANDPVNSAEYRKHLVREDGYVELYYSSDWQPV